MSNLTKRPFLSPFLRWKKKHHFWWHVVIGIFFGLAVEASLHKARDYIPMLTEVETAAADWMMNFWVQGNPDPGPPEAEKTYHPLTWININEATYAEWTEPLTVPRNKLWTLIARAIESDPAIIIVDLALDRALEHPGDELLPGDELIQRCLRQYSDMFDAASLKKAVQPSEDCFKSEALTANTRWPHLLFPVMFNVSKTPTSDDSEKEERPSDFLDGVISSSKILHWTSTTFERDSDFVVRKWRLFEQSVRKDINQENVFPSVPLLAWAILRKPELGGQPFEVSRFHTCLTKQMYPNQSYSPGLGPHDCLSGPQWDSKDSEAGTGTDPVCLGSDGKKRGWSLWDPVLKKYLCVSSNPTDLEQRLIYPLGDFSNVCLDGNPALKDRRPPPRINFKGELVPLIDCHSALEVLAGTVPPKVLEDKVVVIGVSYKDSRDLHITPLGLMPGAAWMMNAIQALLEYGQIEESHGWKKYALIFGLIVLVALIFAKLTSFWASLASAVLLCILLVPTSLWLFKLGTWLDFALPMFGVAAHHLFTNLLDEQFAVVRRYHEK